MLLPASKLNPGLGVISEPFWKGPMERLHQVELAGAIFLLLFSCSSLLAKQSATFCPAQLEKPMGAMARFTCSLPATDQQYFPNWYKLDDENQPRLLDVEKRKYNSTMLNETTFEITISDLEMKDSGTYFCGLIWPSMKLTESNRGNLIITEKQLEPGPYPEETEPGPPLEERGAYGGILLAVAGGVGLFLVLSVLSYYLFHLLKRRQEVEKLRDENAPLEEDRPPVSVFTVDYGVLEFRGPGDAQRAPHERFASDQTEYATIIFPQEKPVAAKGGKKTKNPNSCPSRAEPH